MKHQQIVELCGAFSWLPIESKNPYMISFRHEESGTRLNIYYNKMTVQVQDVHHRQKMYYNVTLEQLEEILTQ